MWNPAYIKANLLYTRRHTVEGIPLTLVRCCYCRAAGTTSNKPGTERVQALAVISRSPLRCHSNETRAPIANSANSAQLGGTPYHYPSKLHPGPCSSVGMWRGTDRHTDARDQYTFRLGYALREM